MLAVFPVSTGINRIWSLTMFKFARVPREYGDKPASVRLL